MSLEIPLSVSEVALLADAAKRNGLSPEEQARQILLIRLTPSANGGASPIHGIEAIDNRSGSLLEAESALNAKLRKSQAGLDLGPHVPIQELFAQWEAEDALLTDEEREEQDRLDREIAEALLTYGKSK